MKPFPHPRTVQGHCVSGGLEPSCSGRTLSQVSRDAVCPCTGQAAWDVFVGDTPSAALQKVTGNGKATNEQHKRLTELLTTAAPASGIKSVWVHRISIVLKTVAQCWSVTTSLCSHLRMKTTSLKTTALSSAHEFAKDRLNRNAKVTKVLSTLTVVNCHHFMMGSSVRHQKCWGY